MTNTDEVSSCLDNDDTLWKRRFWFLTAAFLLLRVFLALSLRLTPDEAYYWEFARRPALSYFDHPPMVGYLISLFRAIFGDTELAVRLPSLISVPVVSIMLFNYGKLLAGPRCGFITSLIFNLTPAAAAAGFITTPDTPLALCWSLGAAVFLRIIRDETVGWWLVLGFLVGCGAMSKYNMVFFVPGVLLTLLVFPRLRSAFVGRGFWFAVLLCALGAMPVIIWNAQHDWISFRFQFSHGMRDAGRPFLQNLGDFLGGQLLTVGPLFWPLLFWFGIRGLIDGWRRNDETRFALAALGLPMMLFFVFNGCRSKVEANWPQMAYLTIMPFVGEWIAAGMDRRRLWAIGATSGLLTALVIMQVLTLVIPIDPGNDISVRMYGWDKLGSAARELDEKTGRTALFIGQGGPLTALIGFYGGIEPDRLMEIHASNNWRIWGADRRLATGATAIYVDDGLYVSEVEAAAKNFSSSDNPVLVPVVAGGRTLRTIQLTVLRGHLGTLVFRK
ncbi:MAG: glycosyltransferase family 39 protein [Candidatus Riflebacteria bacterium]|nr:glycosyltransferase family 39 protein [Candidatus Riflebacteria bacterium]